MTQKSTNNFSLKKEILTAIKKNNTSTLKSIQDETKSSKEELTIALSELISQGLIVEDGQKYFIATQQQNKLNNRESQKNTAIKPEPKGPEQIQMQKIILTNRLYGEQEQVKVDYFYEHKEQQNFIDVIKWNVTPSKTTIALFEIFKEIDHFNISVLNLIAHQKYIASTIDPLFGSMPNKEIQTYLMFKLSRSNFDTITQFRMQHLNSGINFLIFYQPGMTQLRISPITDLKNPDFLMNLEQKLRY